MSREKAIEHGKEHRKPYYDSRRFDWSCRAHGSCPWCERARTIWKKRLKAAVEAAMADENEVTRKR
jgi:hypothetical protein